MTDWFDADTRVISAGYQPACLIDLALCRGLDSHRLMRGSGLFYEDLLLPDAVISARNTALAAAEAAAGKPGDPGAMMALGEAEAGLLGALGKLNVVVEAYPELKANTSMEQLMEELTSTENKIAFSRQAFNDAIMTYNIVRERFPAVIFSGSLGFGSKEQLDIQFPEGGREAPKVEF